MGEFDIDIVCKTLAKVVKILELHDIKYRFLGSVVIAAINGKLHRNLGDLDLIIDSYKKDVLYAELKELGYKRPPGESSILHESIFRWNSLNIQSF